MGPALLIVNHRLTDLARMGLLPVRTQLIVFLLSATVAEIRRAVWADLAITLLALAPSDLLDSRSVLVAGS